MDFLEDYNGFFETEGIERSAFVSVPLAARSPLEAAAQSASLAPRAGAVSFVVEDRWRSAGDAMRSRILAHCGRFRRVYARNCEVRRIPKPVAAAFLSECHHYGDASCRFRYGVFLRDELLAVGEFSSARKWVKGERTVRSYEWVRYASLPGVRVVGGMGKVLETFAREAHPDDVMTYADLEWSGGGAYLSLGFCLEGTRAPVMFAVDPLTWTRRAVAPDAPVDAQMLYYQNFGSLKYRKTYSWNEETY